MKNVTSRRAGLVDGDGPGSLITRPRPFDRRALHPLSLLTFKTITPR